MTTTIFVDRKTELADLEDFLKHPPQGPHRNIALIAPRRTGKTELIKAFRRRNPKAFLPLVEVQRADISASGFVHALLIAYLDALTPGAIASLPTTAAIIAKGQPLPPPLFKKLTDLLDAADRSGLPDDELRREALFFGEDLLSSTKKTGVLILEECQKWFAGPDDEPTNMEKVLAELVNHAKALRVLATGSAPRVLHATFSEARTPHAAPRPLYNRFRAIELHEFTRDDSNELVELLWKGQTYGAEAVSRVFTLTRGHPAATAALAEHVVKGKRTGGTALDPAAVSRAFVDSLFEPLGVLRGMADADYIQATAGRAASVERMLLAIAEAGPAVATAAEIARKSKVAAPNVAITLKPLVLQDLLRIDEKTKTYRFALPLVPIWLRGRQVWVQNVSGLVYAPTLKIVEEELERYRQEKAVGWEAIVRDTASQFDGRIVSGKLFGSAVDVVLPTPNRPVRHIESVDRNGVVFAKNESVELDVYIDGSVVWLGEVKTTGRVTAADIERLHKKAQFFEKVEGIRATKLWFVSTNTYDTKATALAQQKGILYSLAGDINALRKILKKP